MTQNNQEAFSRRKLSADSLGIQLAELETLKKDYDLLHLTKGEIFIQNEFSKFKYKIDQKFNEKIEQLEKNNNLLNSTKSKIITSLEDNRISLLNQLVEEKKSLIKELNEVKTIFDQDVNEIKTDSQNSSENKLILRDRIIYLKQKYRNYIKHFSNLIEFRMSFYETKNSENGKNLIGELDRYPRRYIFTEDILKRVLHSKSKTLRCKKNSNSNQKSVMPLKNHSVLYYNKENLSIFNSELNIRFATKISTQNSADIKWIQFAFSEKMIYLLIQATNKSLYLQSYDYRLNLIKSKLLGDKNLTDSDLKIAHSNAEIFILRNYPQKLNNNQRVYYEIYDENLDKESKRVYPKFFENEDLRSDPVLIGATKEILYLTVSSTLENEVLKSVRLVSRDTGLEISRLENFLFMKYDSLFLSDESEPRVIGLALLAKKSSKEHSFVNKLSVFSATNGSMIKEISFKIKSLSVKPEKIWFLSNGYFAFTIREKVFFF
jgi:hypothetical protein